MPTKLGSAREECIVFHHNQIIGELQASFSFPVTKLESDNAENVISEAPVDVDDAKTKLSTTLPPSSSQVPDDHLEAPKSLNGTSPA